MKWSWLGWLMVSIWMWLAPGAAGAGIPWSNGQQVEFQLHDLPDGSRPGSGLSTPYSVAVDAAHGKMYVADYYHHRVLRFSYPLINSGGMALDAEAVLGQANLTSTDPNRGGSPANSTLNYPESVMVAGNGDLWVADWGNNRVLKFVNAWSLTSGGAASVVLGQGSFGQSAAATTPSGMNGPGAVWVDAAGHLWVADAGNHRVLWFNNAALLGSGIAASGVLGQADFISGSANRGFVAGASTFNSPGALCVSGTTLWVADTDNHRVLRFDNAASKNNGDPADGVLGQPGFFAFSGNEGGGVSASSMYYPQGVAMDASGRLYVSDGVNGRITIFNDASTKLSGAAADNVLGTSSFTSAGMLSNARQLVYDDVNHRLVLANTMNDSIYQYFNCYYTATRLSSSPNPSPASGGTVSFTATVTTAAGGPVVTGDVNFYEGLTSLGSAAVDGTGAAVFSTSGLGDGPHYVCAVLTNTTTHLGSRSELLTETVNPQGAFELAPTDNVEVDYYSGGDSLSSGDNGNSLGVASSGGEPTVAALRFDLSSVSGTIQSATLKVHAGWGYTDGTVPDPQVILYGLSDDAWTEFPPTLPGMAGASTLRTLSLNSVDLTDGDWITLDVTSFVQAQQAGDGIASFKLQPAADSGDCYVGLDSWEAGPSVGPVLEVQMAPLDTTGPVVLIGAPSVAQTNGGTVTFPVTYVDPNFSAATLAPGDITVNPTGTAAGAVLSASEVSHGTNWLVTVGNLSGNGTLSISIAAGTASDTFDNLSLAAGPSAAFAVDTASPSVYAGGQGNLYVVDYQNSRLQVCSNLADLSASQVLVSSLESLRGAAVDAQGFIYAAYAPESDDSKGAISKYDPSGNPVTGFGTSGTVHNLGYEPMGVALRPAGDWLIVPCHASGYVIALDAATGSTNIAFTPIGGLSWPACAAFNKSGTYFYVGTDGGTIYRCPANGGSATALTGVSGFGTVRGLALQDDTHLVVADNSGNTVKRYILNGTAASLDTSFGSSGSVAVSSAWGMTADSTGKLYVSDLYDNTLLKLSAAGAVLGGTVNSSMHWPMQLALMEKVGVSVSPGSGVYAANQTLHFNVGFTEPVTVSGNPQLNLTLGGKSAAAAFVSSAGLTNVLSFSYTIQNGDNGAVAASSINLNGGTIQDGAGNSADVTLPASSFPSLMADTIAPVVAAGNPSVSITNHGPVTYAVTYQDANPSSGALNPTNVTLAPTGTANATILVSGSGTNWTVTLTNITGDGSLAISVKAAAFADAAGNTSAGPVASTAFTVDNTAPSITSTLTDEDVYSSDLAYDIAAAGASSYFTTNLPGGLNLNPTTGIISGTPTQAGTYSIGIGAVDAAGNTNIQVLTLTVDKAPATVTLDSASLSQTYSGSSRVATASTSPSGLGLSYTYNGASALPTNAGNYTVLATVNDANYTGTATGTLTVNPATLTVKAGDASRPYGSTNPPFAISYNGFVNSETTNALASLATATSADSTVDHGTYDITPGGAAAANYTFNYVKGTLTVTKASLQIVGDSFSRAYGSTNPTFTATVTGLTNHDSITPTFTCYADTNSVPKVYKIQLNVNDPNNKLGNYNATSVSGFLSVTNALLTGVVNNQTRAYGTTNLPFTVAYSGFVNNEGTNVLSGELGYSCLDSNGAPADEHTALGVYTISVAEPQTAANYTLVYTNGTLTVIKPVLTVTALSTNRFYGEPNPVFTNTITGFVLGQDASALGGSLTLSCPAGATAGVGQYVIVPAGYTSDTYDINYSNGVLTVDPAALAVGATNNSRTYGAANPAFGGSLTGVTGGDDLSATFSAPLAGAASPVGTYDILPVWQGSIGRLTNYSIVTNKGVLTITAAPLSVAATNLSRGYGQTNPVLGGVLTGVLNGDRLSDTYSTPAIASSPVGRYDITPALLDPDGKLSNYSVTYAPAKLTITAAPLTVTIADASRMYGQTNPAFSGTLTGVTNSDNLSATLASAATPASHVGPYAITPSWNDPSKLANYLVTTNGGTLTVTNAVLTITALSTNRVYGSNNPPLLLSYSGFANGEGTNVLTTLPAASATANSGSPVGAYTISISPAAADNYSFVYVPGVLTVTKAKLLIVGNDASRAYGQANPTFSIDTNASLLGAPSDGISVELSCEADPASPTGYYDIGVTLNDPHDRIGAYDLTVISGTLTVTNAVLTGQVVSQSRAYGQTNPPFAVNYLGFANGQTTNILTGSLNYSCLDGASKPVGTNTGVGAYTIKASGQSGPNYAVVYATGTLTVTQAMLGVTGNNFSRGYGQTNPTFTASYSGFVNNETGSVLSGAPSLTSAANTLSNAGSYSIVVTNGTLSAANYAFGFTNGTLVVTQAVLTVTANNTNRPYGAPDPIFTASYSGFLNGDTSAVLSGQPSLTPQASATSPAGAYTINAAKGALSAVNYAFQYATGMLTVTRAALVASANPTNRLYGQTNPPLTISYSGFVNGETNSVLQQQVTISTSATTNTPVGAYPIVLAGGSDTNYSVTLTNGWLTINKAPLGATADSFSRAYGQTNPALTMSYSGFVNNEGASVLWTPPTNSTAANPSSPVNTYAIVVGTASDTNYYFVPTNGVLTVTQAVVTATADAKTRLYGTPNPALTVSYSGFANNETAGVLTTPVKAATTALLNSPVGTYIITLSGGVGSNYVVNLNTNTLTVTPASLSISANNAYRPYGATNPTFTGAINGLASLSVTAAPAVSNVWAAALLPGAVAQTNSMAGLTNATVAQGFSGGGNAVALGQTFTAPADFVLGEIDILGSVAAGGANPLAVTLNLYDVTGDAGLANANPGYTPASVNGGLNLLGGGAGVSYSFSNAVTGGIIQFAFGTSNQMLLQSNHVYAFEVQATNPAGFSWYRDSGQSGVGNMVQVSSPTNLAAGLTRAPVDTGVRSGAMAVYAAGQSTPFTLTFSTAATNTSPAGTYAIVPSLVDATGAWTNYTVTTNNGTLTVTALLTFDGTPGFYVVSLPAVKVDTNASLTDGGSLVFSNATLTLALVTNATANDLLAVQNQGSGPGQVRVSGSTVSYGGLSLASASGGSGTNPLVLSLTTNATSTNVMALLRQVAFSTPNTNTALRTVRATLSYGGNVVSAWRMITLDRRPVAVDNILYATANQVLTIPYSLVLSNDYDVDGDLLSVTASSLVSSDGGWITEYDGAFVYEPPADQRSEDNFAYIVDDGRGGESAGVVYLRFLPENTLSIQGNGLRANGAALTLAGAPGAQYAIQASTNLVNWSFISTNTASDTGLIQFVDTQAKNLPRRFYRAVAQPAQ